MKAPPNNGYQRGKFTLVSQSLHGGKSGGDSDEIKASHFLPLIASEMTRILLTGPPCN